MSFNVGDIVERTAYDCLGDGNTIPEGEEGIVIKVDNDNDNIYVSWNNAIDETYKYNVTRGVYAGYHSNDPTDDIAENVWALDPRCLMLIGFANVPQSNDPIVRKINQLAKKKIKLRKIESNLSTLKEKECKISKLPIKVVTRVEGGLFSENTGSTITIRTIEDILRTYSLYNTSNNNITISTL